MEQFIRGKLDQSRLDRKQLHTRLVEHCATYRDLLELEKVAFADGAIARGHKELMALAISIVTKCEPCIEWHVQQALVAGATDGEIYETIDVAIEMGGGPAAAYARYALRALDYHRGRDGPEPGA